MCFGGRKSGYYVCVRGRKNGYDTLVTLLWFGARKFNKFETWKFKLHLSSETQRRERKRERDMLCGHQDASSMDVLR